MIGDASSIAGLLRSEVVGLVDTYSTEPSHRAALKHALGRTGFVLHADAPCRAGVLSLGISDAIHGWSNPAVVRAAVAVELYMEAAFMFDNVVDHSSESTPDFPPAEELALGITLLNWGAAVACEAADSVGRPGQMRRSLSAFHMACAEASVGQFLDARLQKQDCATMEEALRMTTLKAGSIGRFAAGFGASMATDDAEMINMSGELGFNLFTYLQLADDLRDACPPSGQAGDLAANKKTVPVVFSKGSPSDERCGSQGGIIQRASGRNLGRNPVQAFKDSGAETFGAIVAETFLNRAKETLGRLEVRVGRKSESLEHLFSSVEFSPQMVFNSP